MAAADARSRVPQLLVDILVAVLVTVTATLITTYVVPSTQRISLVWLGGGVIAGVLAISSVRRNVLLLTMVVIAYFGQAKFAGAATTWAAIATATGVSAMVVYAIIIHRFRHPSAGVIASIWLALGAALLAAGIRLVPIGIALAVGIPGAPEDLAGSAAVTVLATVPGLLAGSATIFGLVALPQYLEAGEADTARRVIRFALICAVVLVTFYTSVGSWLPGSEYLISVVILVGAISLPMALSSILTGVAALVIASAGTLGTGPFVRDQLLTVQDEMHVQAYILVIVMGVLLLAAAIEQRRQAESAVRSTAQVMSSMFRNSPVASAWVDVDSAGRIALLEVNSAFSQLVGVAGPDTRARYLDEVLKARRGPLTADTITVSDLEVTTNAGNVLWLRCSLTSFADTPIPRRLRTLRDGLLRAPVTTESPLPETTAADAHDILVLVAEDVTAARTFEAISKRHAQRDQLTGFLSRQALTEEHDTPVGSDGRRSFGVIMVNINGLRAINNTFGYQLGDRVLAQLAERMRTTASDHDTLVRASGDEFVVMVRDRSQSDVEQCADDVLASISQPLSLAGRSIIVTASAGTGWSDDPNVAEADVVTWADEALSHVKSATRNLTWHYRAGDEQTSRTRVVIASELATAIAQRSFVCHFQPVVRIATGEVVGAEVLVRLPGADGQLVPPLQFIPLAIELGLIGAITEQVVDQACQAIRAWREEHVRLYIAFNSPRSWVTPAAFDFIEKTLRRHGLTGSDLTLEATEDEATDFSPSQLEVLALLRATGTRVAIDDFGTGYAGLGLFRALPADIVKIDRSFVTAMLLTDQDRRLVESMIELAHRFGKVAIAEGVETIEQYRALGHMGCEYAQGFLIGRPVVAESMPTGVPLSVAPEANVPAS